MKAKVFLSCGQSKESDEPVIAERIAQRIRDEGFDCYMAVAEQTLLGLRENIFTQLETADYIVFIDFKREELKTNATPSFCRGSLFSHQELAIASFLEIPALILQESGIMERDGMLGAMQANAIPFTDRNLLSNVVADLIHQKLDSGIWTNQTRNQLTLELPNPLFAEATQADQSVRRHYHVVVHNHHFHKAALKLFCVS
jgi:hypothetical protein